MRGVYTYLCAALLGLLTALRLFFPAQAETAQAWVRGTVDPRSACGELARSLGRELSRESLRDGLTAVVRLAEESWT